MRFDVFSKAFVVVLLVCSPAFAAEPATQPVGHFPFLDVDARTRMIRVECEALDCRAPLEFFCCAFGTNEHESVLHSKVKPSHLHAALLMLGLKPGEPVHFSEAKNAWIPPSGPPIQIAVEFDKEGKHVSLPAYRLMRDLTTKKEMPPMTWIFAGSRVMDNGIYAADQTGYIVSVVNFDLTLIDIPKLASSANETLEWETNTDLMPPAGTKVFMVITPADGVQAPATTQHAQAAPIDQTLISIDALGQVRMNDVVYPPAAMQALAHDLPAGKRVRVAVANSVEDNPAARDVINALSAADVQFSVVPQAAATTAGTTTRPGETLDEPLLRRLQAQQWDQSVASHDTALRDAAKTHAQIIAQLRAEQQRLIDKADHIQRLIDDLEKRYQDMTTPPPQ